MPFRQALPLRPPDPRKVLPGSTPTPKAPTPGTLTALTLKGPLLVTAILAGAKRCENRSWQIQPGWYALHLGSGEASEKEETAWRTHCRASEDANPPVPPGIGSSALPPRACIVGAICIGQSTKVVSTGAADISTGGWSAEGWAVGPRVHRITHVVPLPTGIRKTGIRGKLSLWSVASEETAGLAVAKSVCHAIETFLTSNAQLAGNDEIISKYFK
mmetsp:Transcript_30/g.95  ORF Transcript_30/g.95 Transcript_30/m.95 type:complete len:216 (+) Transcript_30:237-884(+)